MCVGNVEDFLYSRLKIAQMELNYSTRLVRTTVILLNSVLAVIYCQYVCPDCVKKHYPEIADKEYSIIIIADSFAEGGNNWELQIMN